MITKRNYMIKFHVSDFIKWKTTYIDSWLVGSSAGEMSLLPGRQAAILI